MSARYPDLACLCRWFVVRNEDIVAVRDMADEEAVAYYSAERFFSGDWPVNESRVIDVYHT
jgi:hypothetical protein